jgi:hypothetical protein
MNKKKTKINVLLILIVIFLVVTVLLIRFEINPFSYFTGGNEDDEQQNNVVAVNHNGVYRYKETLDKTYKIYTGCTLSYYDYYIVIRNNEYYRYKSSCTGTYFLDKGRAKDLKIEKTLEGNYTIVFDEKTYLKTDLVSSIRASNYLLDNLNKNVYLQAENYHLMFLDAQPATNFFPIDRAFITSNNITFRVKFTVNEDNSYVLQLMERTQSKVLYTYHGEDLHMLPLFRGIGTSITVIEPYESDMKYSYSFRRLTPSGFTYDLQHKFPIVIDGDTLDYNDSIYIKYSPTDNAYIMLVGENKNFCVEGSNSKDIAYYVFHIKYDYVKKEFDNPKFIDKVYKNEGCKFVDDLMEA